MIDIMIEAMSTQLGINQGTTESSSSWKTRVIYSTIGLQMLAAMYDRNELLDEDKTDDNSVSMQHVLFRGQQLEGVYAREFAWAERNYAEYIRNIYIATGHMLHKANRLAPPSTMSASEDSISFLRGVLPWNVEGMCGLGLFAVDQFQPTTHSIFDMFHLEKSTLSEWFASFLKGISWKGIESLPSHVEYLNITGKERNGYWTDQLPVQGLTLCRYKDDRERAYKVLRLSENIEQSSLPLWRVEDREYIRIALALRTRANNPPTISIQRDGNIAQLNTSYLLPPAEQNFFELYSWPADEHLHWKRTVSMQLLPSLVNVFTHQGFKVLEV